LPAGVLVAAGDRVGEDREGNRTETGEAGEDLFFLGGGSPLLALDGFKRADSGDEIAALRFLAAGDEGRGVARGCGYDRRSWWYLLRRLRDSCVRPGGGFKRQERLVA
jgi:hypothetical protein